MRKRKIIISILLVLAFVGVVSSAWVVHMMSYDKYKDENLERLSYSLSSYVDWRGPVIYGIKTPPYLEFGGNLYCNNEDNTITILAWPSFMCRDIKKLGIILATEDGGGYQVYVDENLDYDYELNKGKTQDEYEEIQKIMKNKSSEIYELYHGMRERFNMNEIQ